MFTSFVGRGQEINELRARIADSRLLTLTGIGGVGKSRLAQEVARASAGTLVHEICLVELATIADPNLVPNVVATALGVHDSGPHDLIDTLVTRLSGRSALLLLDNCEHLVTATGDLILALLHQCPDLRVLATSRIPLAVQGEGLWQVEPLPVPSLDALPSRTALMRNAAIRLFVDRARAADPHFRLTDENSEDVVRVCARVDGIPLALELAAARVVVLRPRQLVERLDQRLHVLTGGSRTELPHHRTLRAMIDWSHDLLGPAEERLFRRLAVFVGGWTLDAAEAVCPGDDLTQAQVLDLLSQLIAHSLVQPDHGHSEIRFRLLDTIREYALAKLRDAGEEDALRQRHFRWVHGVAAAADVQLWTAEQGVCLDRLTLDLENVRAALAWAMTLPAEDAGLQITTRLWRFWEQRGLAREGRTWIQSLLNREPVRPSPARATGLAMLAFFAYVQGDPAVAVSAMDEAIALARSADEQPTLILVLLVHSLLDGAQGNLGAADGNLQEALARSRTVSYGPGARMAIQNLAVLHRMRGDDEQAAALLQEGLTLCLNAGDHYTEAFFRSALGHLALLGRNLDVAAREFGQVAVLMRDLQDVQNLSMAMEGLGWTASARGLAGDAARLLGAAEGMRERVGAVVLPQWIAEHHQALELVRSALGEPQFSRAWEAGRGLTPEDAMRAGLQLAARSSSGDSRATTARRGLGPTLSAREIEVARLVADGLTNRQIAERLVLQESTVGNHLQRIYARLGLSGRAQLATWMAEHGSL